MTDGFVLDQPDQISHFRIASLYYVAVLSMRRVRMRHTAAAWRALAIDAQQPVPRGRNQRMMLLNIVSATHQLTPPEVLLKSPQKEAKIG